MRTLFVAVVVVVGLIAAILWRQGRVDPLVVSGFVEADDIRLGSRVGGRVAAVHASEGERVRAGAALVELEPFDLAERRAEAAALVAEREAELARLVAGPRVEEIAAARSRAQLGEAELELAEVEFERARKLAEGSVVSVEVRDRAERQLKVARAELDVRSHELAELEDGSRREDVAAAEAALAAARAALGSIDRRQTELVVRAPIDAVVESIELRPGDLVAADAPVLSLLDPARLWVRAYVPENRISLDVGDEVSVTIDAFPGERFPGRVEFVARAAEFTPRNVQTPEERAKQVFRVKIRLDEGQDRLRPGMAADVRLDPAE